MNTTTAGSCRLFVDPSHDVPVRTGAFTAVVGDATGAHVGTMSDREGD